MSVDRGPAASRALFVVAIASLWVSGCIQGERLHGPTIAVRNDTARAIVVRVNRQKYELVPNASGDLAYIWGLTDTVPMLVEILDPTSCTVVGSITLAFTSNLDPLVIVPPTGSPTESTASSSDRNAFVALQESANLCPRPEDGWTIAVGNSSSVPYFMTANSPEGYPITLGVGKVAPGSVTAMPDFLYNPAATGAGSLILFDANCHVLDTIQHGAWGTFVVTISGGKISIETGPVPVGIEWLPTVTYSVCPSAQPGAVAPTPSR